MATMTVIERAFYEVSAAVDKDTPMVRGWNAANTPAVQAAITQYNVREAARCEAAALELLAASPL